MLGHPKQTRSFGTGVTGQYVDKYRTLADARNKANSLNKMGIKTRITSWYKDWAVYRLGQYKR